MSPEAERSYLRDRFVRALKRLKNFDSDRIRLGASVLGERYHHWVDVAIVDVGAATAFAHALPLRSAEERPVFMHRGLILEAAADMSSDAPRLAMYDDPPDARRDLVDETRALMADAHVEMVGQLDLATAAARWDDTVWQSVS